MVVELTQVAKKNTNDLMDVQLYMHFLCSHFLLKTERDGFMIYHIIIKRKNLMDTPKDIQGSLYRILFDLMLKTWSFKG